MNAIFLPMFLQGLAGLNRRLYDGGRTYQQFAGFQGTFTLQAWAAVVLGVFQLFFIVNLFWSLARGRRVSDNPWEATTLEWATTSPPPHAELPGDRRGAARPVRLQPARHGRRLRAAEPAMIPYTLERRADTGVTNVTMGIWLFLASEVMLFGALFSAYALLRTAAPAWPHGRELLNLVLGATNTAVLFAMTLTVWTARRMPPPRAARRLAVGCALAIVFLAVKGLEYRGELAAGLWPSSNTFMAMYFTLTGLHAVHVAGGVIANVWIMSGARRVAGPLTAGRVRAVTLYWAFVEIVWLALFATLYLS